MRGGVSVLVLGACTVAAVMATALSAAAPRSTRAVSASAVQDAASYPVLATRARAACAKAKAAAKATAKAKTRAQKAAAARTAARTKAACTAANRAAAVAFRWGLPPHAEPCGCARG